MSRGKLFVQVLVSVALTVVCLWFAFRHVDFSASLAALAQVRLGTVVVFILATIFVQLVRIIRWRLLLVPLANLPWRFYWGMAAAGMLMVVILPLRLGELARPYFFERAAKGTFGGALATVVVERAMDGLVVTLLFFATLAGLHDGPVPTSLRIAAYGALLLFGGALVALTSLLVLRETFLRLLDRLCRPLGPNVQQRLQTLCASFLTGVEGLRQPAPMLWFLFWTAVYWGAQGVAFWIVMRGFGWEVPIYAGYLMGSIIVLGIMIPAGPGFLGTFQAAVTTALWLFGVDATGAAAYGFIVYPVSILVQVALGLPYFFRHKLAGLPMAGST